MGKDLMFILLNDDNKLLQYSKQLMCEDTGISYEEPSPNSFSFNSPYGACPVCKGLGAVYRISLDAIIPDRKKSVNEGGIEPLGSERDAYTFTAVQKLARKNKFSLDIPIEDMPLSVSLPTINAMIGLLEGLEKTLDNSRKGLTLNQDLLPGRAAMRLALKL